MAEVKSDEASLFTKRKPDLVSFDKDNTQEKTDDLNKKQKLGVSSTDPLISESEEHKDVNGKENITIQGDKGKDIEEDDDDEDEEAYEAQGDDKDDEDDEDEYDDSDDDHSNGNAETVDLKGKGIMMDDKGKGKLVEESEDSSECGSESDGDGDSDLSDDPLAEVDLDNILPTRTRSRSRVVQPGIHISDNQGSKEDENDGSGDN